MFVIIGVRFINFSIQVRSADGTDFIHSRLSLKAGM